MALLNLIELRVWRGCGRRSAKEVHYAVIKGTLYLHNDALNAAQIENNLEGNDFTRGKNKIQF
jgi:hypothetical protein